MEGDHYMRLSLFAAAAVIVLSGCNSMFQDSYQKITVLTPGVENADCILQTPRRALVERSGRPLGVVCKKVGYYPGAVTVRPKIRMAPSQLNVFNGVIPGLAYDVINNSVYDYPDTIVVTMRRMPMPDTSDLTPVPYELKKREEAKPIALVPPAAESKADESFNKSLNK
jgi:hypothetical protein